MTLEKSIRKGSDFKESNTGSGRGARREGNDSFKTFLKETAKSLKGAPRRLFMARTVKELGYGGQSLAERELGWNRETIRKGTHELKSGLTCVDAFSMRGRKRAEALLPNLLIDLKAIVDGQSQVDPKFQTNRLYTRLSAQEIRNQLIQQKGYEDKSLPTAGTIAQKLNKMGYYPKKVRKTQPKKTGSHRCDLRATHRAPHPSRVGRNDAPNLDRRESPG